MKILLANDRYHFQNSALRGGTEEYLAQISQRLSGLGHQIIILFEEGEFNRQNQNIKECQIKGLSNFAKKTNVGAISQVKKIIRQENPDVVNIHNIQNSSIIKILIDLAPTVRYIHDHRVTCPGFSHFFLSDEALCPYPFSIHCLRRAYTKQCATRRPLKLLKNFFQTKKDIKINKNLSLIHAASSYMKKALVQNSFEERKIEVLPDYVELPNSTFDQKTAAGNNKEKIVLFAGRITIEKGLKYLIQAMEKVKKAKLIVIGGGPELEKDKNLTKKLNLGERIKFLGWLNHQDLHRWYQKADVVVFPSVWPEPFGRIGGEAMFHKKPLVAFPVGGAADWLVDGKNGFFAELKNINDLAEKINLLLNSKELAEKMGNWGYQFAVENYSKETYFEKLVKIYEKAIDNYSSKFKSQNVPQNPKSMIL